MSKLVSRLDALKTEENQIKFLRKIGVKATQQRLRLLDIVANQNSEFTSSDIYDEVTKVDKVIGFATVYRFLNCLENCGLIKNIKSNNARFNVFKLNTLTEYDHYKNFTKLVIAQASQCVRFPVSSVKDFAETVILDAIDIFGRKEVEKMVIHEIDSIERANKFEGEPAQVNRC